MGDINMQGKGIAHGLVNIVLDAAGMAGGVLDKITESRIARPIISLALGVPLFVSCLPVSVAMNSYYVYLKHKAERSYKDSQDFK